MKKMRFFLSRIFFFSAVEFVFFSFEELKIVIVH